VRYAFGQRTVGGAHAGLALQAARSGEFSAAGVAVPRVSAFWCRARRLCGARVGSGLVAVVEGAATRRLTGRGDSLGGRTGVGGR
jgi:hypothetical protein